MFCPSVSATEQPKLYIKFQVQEIMFRSNNGRILHLWPLVEDTSAFSVLYRCLPLSTVYRTIGTRFAAWNRDEFEQFGIRFLHGAEIQKMKNAPQLSLVVLFHDACS